MVASIRNPRSILALQTTKQRKTTNEVSHKNADVYRNSKSLKKNEKVVKKALALSTDNNLLDGGRVGREVGVGSVMGGPTKKSEQKYKNATRL